MNLLETPAGFDDPLAMWSGCHRRIEKQLKTLEKLAEHVARHGVDAEATGAAQAVLRYFEKSAVHHHADEDDNLFPLLAGRITNSRDRERFSDFIEQAGSDHQAMAAAWARLRKPLQTLAEGLPKCPSIPEVNAFCALYKAHIPLEEGTIPDLARAYLTAHDLETLGRAMAGRRGVTYSV